MTFTRILMAGAVAGLLLSSAAIAQTATPAPAPAPAAAAAPAASASSTDKKAISKACSDEATKQNLHGKARKSFRSKCKADKMKGAM